MKLLFHYTIFLVAISVKITHQYHAHHSIPKHYQELNCQPIIKDGNQCVTSYKCPDFKSLLNPDKCLVNGNYFNTGDNIPDSALSLCKGPCYCKSDPKQAQLLCGITDCPENLGQIPKECLKIRPKNSCCSKKFICEKEEISKLAMCEFDETKYYEGQAMYSKDFPCYACECTSDFNGTDVINNPNCELRKCNIDTDIQYLTDGCVPIYHPSQCCPIDWKCPKDGDSIVRGDSQPTCNFGNLKLNVGDSLASDKNWIKCSCITPPLLYCEELQGYYY